ncbi:MAG: lipopolysaccharide biosynthesis protein [Candidatus Aminicenantes bacterium]|nr:lipopolysaccharide biosynthesis protein [Candidatus Aminicenantes bacterium]
MPKFLARLRDRLTSGDAVGRVFRNAGKLLAGTTAAALLGLGSNVLAARRLGPEAYGFLVLLSTFLFAVVFGLLSFQSWQAIIHYGAKTLVDRREADLKRLVKFGFILDGATSIVAVAIGAGAVFLYGRSKGWDPALLTPATISSAGLFLRLTGTSVAVLRLFNRFDLLAFQQAAAAAVRLLVVAFLFVRGAALTGFLYGWLATEIAGHALLTALALVEIRRRGVRGLGREPLRGLTTTFPGLWKFLLTTNLYGTTRLGARELDIMIVGGVLGPAAAGLFKIVRQFARAVGRLDDVARQAIYPDLSKTWARRDTRRFGELIRGPALILGGAGFVVWVGFLLFGRPVLNGTVGPAYAAAYGPILIYLVGVMIAMATFHFQSVLLAMGRPGELFRVTAGTTLAYFAVLFFLVRSHEVLGAASAYVAYQALWSAWLGVAIRNRRRFAAKAEEKPAETPSFEDVIAG